MKRTTLMVDAALLDEARRALGARTYSEAVNRSLEEAVRRAKVRSLAEFFGSNCWEGDLDAMRRNRFPPNAKRRRAAAKAARARA